jgi:hypothetical protein
LIFFDLIGNSCLVSCLNGWTFGNIASTGSDLTTFYCDLFAAIGSAFQLVNGTSLGEMLKFQPLSNTHMVPRCVDLSLPRRGSRPMLRRVV